ncbi:hypothetical protein [Pseudomonas sp. BRM28]|uniref:hypothetical protein n=1 Tax=Pseudomonas sp. BRM28 TaxID=2045201 RepID=UPI001304C993|nr:hypothetical protein [Pseudomonas sp. BRM28]
MRPSSPTSEPRGVPIGDLALPFEQAVATGDAYYLVWPVGSAWRESIERLRVYLLG